MSANMQMMEDSVHFLSKETVVQAIARSATKVLFLIIDFFSVLQDQLAVGQNCLSHCVKNFPAS